MTYTYDDIVTAKDILTGRVKREDIIGKKGWFFDCMPKDMSLDTIKREISHTLKDVNPSLAWPFISDETTGDGIYQHFLPEKEKSYEERQKEWIAANNIKLGDKVRILRKARDHENGWLNRWGGLEMDREVGKIGRVTSIFSDIRVDTDTNWFFYPYFVLEKVEDEPEYVPLDLSREEDRQLLRDRWIRSKQTGNEARIVCFKHTREHDWQAHIPQTGLRSGFELLNNYEFLDGSPIGKPANGRQIRRKHDSAESDRNPRILS